MSLSLVKDYGDVGVWEANCSVQVKGFGLFGVSVHWVVVVDICGRCLCRGKIKSPFESTYSLQVCCGGNGRVYLSIGGAYPDYSMKVPDLLDVTDMIEKEGMGRNSKGLGREEIVLFREVEDGTSKCHGLRMGGLDLDILEKESLVTGRYDKV